MRTDEPIAVGTELPPLRATIESWHMVAYAGATWDWHRMHHDTAAARDAGLEAPVVDGQMFGDLLVRHVRGWLSSTLAEQGQPPEQIVIERLHLRYRGFVYPGATVVVTGSVAAVEPGTGSLEIVVDQRIHDAARPEADIVAPAGATVVVRTSPGAAS